MTFNIFPFLPHSLGQINSSGYASLGYSLNESVGDYKRCIESYRVQSTQASGVITLPNGAKYDQHHTYDSRTVMGQFQITWSLIANQSVSVDLANIYFGGDIQEIDFITYGRVRVYATLKTNGTMWYLNTRGISLSTTIEPPGRLWRVTATLDPYVNYWQEGGPSTAT